MPPSEVVVTEPISISGLQRLSRELTAALAHDARQITLDFTMAGPVPVYVVGLLNRIAAVLALRQGTLHLRGLSGFEAAMMLAGGLDRRVDVEVRPGEQPPGHLLDRTDPHPPGPAA